MIIAIFLLVAMAIAFILMSISGQPAGSPVKSPSSFQQPPSGQTLIAIPFTQKLLAALKLDVKIKQKLDAAHVRFSISRFFNLQLFLAIGLGIGSFFIFGEFRPLVFFIAVAFGYMLPNIWLNRKIATRKGDIAMVIPETVDLLGLCIEAGLDFTIALKWITEKISTNPLIEEFAFLLEEIKWGKPRAQALKDMAKRLNIPEISSFVQTIVQAERMGTPVSEAFVNLSEDTRMQRFHRGERIAMQAPIKILIPLIFCILPVIAIIIGGPILLQFTQGGMLKGF